MHIWLVISSQVSVENTAVFAVVKAARSWEFWMGADITLLVFEETQTQIAVRGGEGK